MFSKHEKALIKSTTFENGSIVQSHCKNLPNKRVLFLLKNMYQNKTVLKIFSTHNLNICLVEKTLEGNWDLRCIFPDGSILIQVDLKENTLIKLCSKTLNIISTSICKAAYWVEVIDNDSFFEIRNDNSSNSGKLKYDLCIYKWKASAYVESCRVQFFAHLGSNAYISDIKSVGKNRFCCHWEGRDAAEFKVLIFDINPNTHAIKEIGLIEPKQHKGNGVSVAYGRSVVLSNGQLLTYRCQNNVQIWDTDKLSCVKEWNWDDMQLPKEFFLYNVSILPFQDSTHLLVHFNEKIYLLNTQKLIMNPIDFGREIRWGKLNILANEEVLILLQRKYSGPEDRFKIMHFNLPKITNFQKIMAESQHLTRLFFNRSGLPVEITNHICSYAFTPEAREILARNDNNRNCSVM